MLKKWLVVQDDANSSGFAVTLIADCELAVVTQPNDLRPEPSTLGQKDAVALAHAFKREKALLDSGLRARGMAS
jgi:hypothetical protein